VCLRIIEQGQDPQRDALQLAPSGFGQVEHGPKRFEMTGDQPRAQAGLPQLFERTGSEAAATAAADVYDCQAGGMAGRFEHFANGAVQHRGALVAAQTGRGQHVAVMDELHRIARAAELGVAGYGAGVRGIASHPADPPTGELDQDAGVVERIPGQACHRAPPSTEAAGLIRNSPANRRPRVPRVGADNPSHS
jgi:hypothetical protein